MVLSTLLGIFPINYTKFLDFLAGKIFGPKVLNFDVIALKLAHRAQNCLKMEPKSENLSKLWGSKCSIPQKQFWSHCNTRITTLFI